MLTDHACRRAVAGFTLVETLVALVIVALGMTAVYMQLGQYAANSLYLRDKTLASWIGSNAVTTLSIAAEWPALGDDEDVVTFGGRDWNISIEISETDVENLRRADVSVALAEDAERVVHTVSALIEPPLPPGFPPASWQSVNQGGGPGPGFAPPGGAAGTPSEPEPPQ